MVVEFDVLAFYRIICGNAMIFWIMKIMIFGYVLNVFEWFNIFF